MPSARPNDERPDRLPSNPRRAVLATAALVIAQWILASARIFSCLLPLVLTSGVIWAARGRRWSAIALLLAASPLAVSFARGISAYRQPHAYMMTTGLQQSGDTFIDRHTRLPIGTSGCLIDGNEWVRDVPYNLALHFVTGIVGPPAGTYGGPLPTDSEARAALVHAASLDWRVLAEDRVRIDDRSIALQRWLGPALIRAVYRFDPLRDEPSSPLAPEGLIRARLWRGQIVLIELLPAFRFEGERSHVAVVAASSGRLLGHFPGSGRGSGFPLPGHDVEGPPSF